MKLKLNPEFSTTYIQNECNSLITIDLAYRKIKRGHMFKDGLGRETFALTVLHPLQEGETTYFMKRKQEIDACIAHCSANGIKIITS